MVQTVSWEHLPLTSTPEGIVVLLLGIIAFILIVVILHKMFFD